MNYESGTGYHMQMPGGFSSNAALNYQDFWPRNLTPQEKLKRARFETFDVLVGRLNSWLAQNSHIEVKNLQTVEKKVASYEELNSDTVKCDPRQGGWTVYLKGLRVWYGTEGGGNHPGQIGYMNILPRIVDESRSTPAFEKLSGIFQNINSSFQSSPIPGQIITVETVSLQFHEYDPRHVFPDVNTWIDGYVRNIFSFIRIFFRYGDSVPEIIGSADFVPECLKDMGTFSFTGPKFAPSFTVFEKINEWLRNLQNVRIVNIQCLETPYPDKAEMIDSSISWIITYESWFSVKFIRVYFARPVHGSIQYPIPQHISVKTFLPSRVHRSCCLRVTTFEPMSGLDHYVREWLRVVGKRVLFAELQYRTVADLEARTDYLDDCTVMAGHWFTTRNKNHTSYHRHHLVLLVRVYLEGNYTEPPPHYLPPKPHFEDKACCTIL